MARVRASRSEREPWIIVTDGEDVMLGGSLEGFRARIVSVQLRDKASVAEMRGLTVEKM